jgi:prepilin-type N-terminal cleavage/methylation domain-containing protein
LAKPLADQGLFDTDERNETVEKFDKLLSDAKKCSTWNKETLNRVQSDDETSTSLGALAEQTNNSESCETACRMAESYHTVTGEGKKAAFTLAEVLITLGIIGVVAAMTIPTLISNMKAIKLQTQFKEAYSIISQAVKAYNGDDERTDAGQSQATYKSFMKYFKGVTDCGNASQVAVDSKYCFIRNSSTAFNQDQYYKNYAKNSTYIETQLLDDGQFYLSNGMLIAFNTVGVLAISVDINGKGEKPNAWGHDVFTFQLIESEKEGGYELLPMGAPSSTYNNKSTYCSTTNTSKTNGIACTYYALTDSEYFKNLPK